MRRRSIKFIKPIISVRTHDVLSTRPSLLHAILLARVVLALASFHLLFVTLRLQFLSDGDKAFATHTIHATYALNKQAQKDFQFRS